MSSSLILHDNKPFLDWIVMCDEKWTVYDNQRWPAQWLDQEVPKHFPKPNLNQKKKKVMVTVWWSAAHLIHYSLLNPQGNHYMWEVCSVIDDTLETAMPAAGIEQQKGPNSAQQCPTAVCTTSTSKVEQTGLGNFASSTIFTWPLANRLPLLQASWQLFAEKTLPQPAWGIKCFPRVR